MANMVPRLSTCTFTPISNMSAAGAMVTSACPASASILRTGSELPDSTHAWFTDPVTTYAAPIANAAATRAGVAMPPASPTRGGVGVAGTAPGAGRAGRGSSAAA